jgi:TPR repeat protein
MNDNKTTRRLPVLILQLLVFLGAGIFLGYLYQKHQMKDPKAQLAVAHEALANGDDGTAFRLFSGLAESGNARAQYWLADMYEYGYGVKKDIPEAISWMEKAANQGLATAQGRLGEIYFAGQETVQDFKAARKWLQKAANQNNAVAERRLAQMMEQGLGGPKDPVQAYVLYEQAILDGDGYSERLRNSLLKHMTPAQVSEAQGLAKKLDTSSDTKK